MYRLLIFLFMLIAGCSSPDGEEQVTIEEKVVPEASLLIGTDYSHEVGAPSEIKAVNGGFLVYDYALEEIFKLDHDGNKLLSFGRRGRGPGEFQDVFGMWEFNNGYWVYDHSSAKFVTYDHEGNQLTDFPVTYKGFPTNSPTRVEMINPREFVIASGGKEGFLLSLVNLEEQNPQYFGNVIGELEDKIPPGRKNEVIVSSNQTGIFSFQQSTALLEKYSRSGELIWQQSVKVPAIEDLFEHLFRENRRRVAGGEFSLPFIYARRMSANKDGVAILLNVIEDQPLTVAWVPNDGQYVTVVTFPGIKNKLLGLAFTISAEGSYIFFVDALEGKLYRAEWPI